MPCYSPLRAALFDGPKGRVLSFSRTARGKALSLPCGRCIGCRLERSRQWAVRIMHEAKMHDANSFLTLTYSDEFLPKFGSISVEHCQLFLKRLRARLAPVKIRFFLCGEYGEKLGRPHYHAIIFGYDFPDKVKLVIGGDHELFTSSLLSDVWGLGHCSIGSVSFDSASYVANYATKKVNGKGADKHYGGRKPEFLLMSRRPGIGRAWIGEYVKDVYPSDEVIVRGVEARPPRYYDKYFESLDPVSFQAVKVKRLEDTEFFQARMLYDGSVNLEPVEHPEQSNRRLVVRENVARAKAELKSRRMEKGS